MNMLSTSRTRHGILLATMPLLFTLGSCGEKVIESVKPKLPDATQDGKNTFGCKLDDKLWLPASDHTLVPPLDADLTPGGFTLTAFDDHNDAPGWEEFNLSLNAATFAPGTYTLSNGFSAKYWSRGNDASNVRTYVAGAGNTAKVVITKVEPRTTTTTVLGNPVTSRFTVVSGTFEFTATAPDGSTITVREGRFDVQAF
jgi:hypothetical protein